MYVSNYYDNVQSFIYSEFFRILTISGTQEQIKKAQSLLPPCVAVGNPQESRSAEENNDVLGHPGKKKPLPVLKWHSNVVRNCK